MTQINWGLATLGQQNFENALARGQQMGAQVAGALEQRRYRNALETYAANPDTPEGINALMKADPRLGLQLRAQQQQQAARVQEQRQVNMTDVAKLFDGVTPENYGQRLAIAQQWGLDTSQAPQAFDPAWVQQQQVILDAFVNDEEGMSGIARELVDGGFEPGTPQFVEAIRGVIQNKYASEYVDEAGNTRRRSALALPGGPAAEGGLPRVNTPEEAMSLPPGTQFLTPDGRVGTVPGGSGGNAAGGFPGY